MSFQFPSDLLSTSFHVFPDVQHFLFHALFYYNRLAVYKLAAAVLKTVDNLCVSVSNFSDTMRNSFGMDKSCGYR